jgi:molecular chaperone GrpE
VSKHKSHPHETARPPAETPPPPPVPPEKIPSAEAAPAPEDAARQLRAELEAARNRELRWQAELENYRKRAARDLEEQLRYANLALLRDLLPVIDNVGRAIAAAEKQANAEALLAGFKMVAQQLEDVLERHHCTRIEALHAPFDPNVHHALMQQPSQEHPANTVLSVAQNGYQLHDRVVRPSQVIVSTPQP